MINKRQTARYSIAIEAVTIDQDDDFPSEEEFEAWLRNRLSDSEDCIDEVPLLPLMISVTRDLEEE